MSQQQSMRDQQAQPGSTTPAYDDDRIHYPDVPPSEQGVKHNPVGGQVNGPVNVHGRPLGTKVMGDPAKPGDQRRGNFDADSKFSSQRGQQFVGGQEQNRQAAGNPYVQQPEPVPNQLGQRANLGQRASPYVQTSAQNGGKTPMDTLQGVFNKWSKKAEGLTGNVWTHLSTGPNVTETALGRLSAGTKILQGGGFVNLFKKEFPPISDNEQLLKTYACYLSTSTGPVSGTLFLSTERLAFASDRPLSTTPEAGVEKSWHYFKLAVPLDRVVAVNPTENPKKASEKYIQVETVDKHEFWFMGFVNYDKGVKSIQEAVNGTLSNKSNAPNRPSAVGA